MSIATPKKRAANRANAAKSTGPRTPEGKRQSSRNAVTHGLFCRAAILPGEDPAELERLRRGMMARLRPRDALERMLADRVVSEAWRLRRAVAFEARVIASKTIEEQARRERYRALSAGKPPLHAGQIIRGLLGADVLTKLSRYEQRIERSMYRAMAELRRLQGESLPEGEWLDTEAEDEPADEPAAAPDDADDRPAAKRRTRKTKPRPENSENDGPPAEEDEEVEDYEDEDERGRETKPRRENSENHEPLVEEDEEEEDYEDDDGGRKTKPNAENSENDEPAVEEEEEEEDYEDDDEEERGRETKPKPDYSRVMLAVPRSQPPAPARARRPGRF